MGQRPGYRKGLFTRLNLLLPTIGAWVLLSTSTAYACKEVCPLNVSANAREYDLHYDACMIPAALQTLDNDALVSFYRHLEKSNGQLLLESIGAIQSSMQLDDWQLFKVVGAAAEDLLPASRPAERELLKWFLMSKLGYDTRVIYNHQNAFLYIFSEEELYEISGIEDRQRKFYNFSSNSTVPGSAVHSYFLDFSPGAGGKPLSFQWLEKPASNGKIETVSFAFNYREAFIQMNISYDRVLSEKLAELPILNETRYFDIPLSPILEESLIPQLKKILCNKSAQSRIEVLLALTRNGFNYQDDHAQFSREKPMAPDEIFHYNNSDCEDRTILFYQLARRFLNLPMVVISFEKHLSFGIALPWGCEEPLQFNGINYCVCDPTGPVHEIEPGRWPEKYKNQVPEVIKIWP